MAVQRLESELKHCHAIGERKEQDFNMAIGARDEALREVEKLRGQLETVENQDRHKVRISSSDQFNHHTCIILYGSDAQFRKTFILILVPISIPELIKMLGSNSDSSKNFLIPIPELESCICTTAVWCHTAPCTRLQVAFDPFSMFVQLFDAQYGKIDIDKEDTVLSFNHLIKGGCFFLGCWFEA